MDYLKLNENVCRICLENNVILNWNDEIFVSCGMSYKDCYYKYTQLIENDSDCYPTNLCENCSNELKNAHMLFVRAVESYNIIRIALDDKTCFSSDCINEQIMKTENPVSNSDDALIREDIEIELGKFEDINLETPSETPFEKEEIESCITNLSIATTETSCDESQLYTRNFNATPKSDRLLKLCNSESADTKPSVPKLTKRRKKREKLCQYCSLKVHESSLKNHEATHKENRERKEACPQCGIKFYDKLALYEHMKIHRKNRQKDHKCEFCEKAFFNKGGLNVHRRIHLGLMVKCQICSKEYYRQVDLNKHLLIHSAAPLQKISEKLKYRVHCQYCNKTVLTNSWKQHKAAHLNQPQTKCKICDKNFFSRSGCRKHIQKVHRKRDFDQFIYYHVDPNTRMSHLMMVQQEKVEPLTE